MLSSHGAHLSAGGHYISLVDGPTDALNALEAVLV